MRWLRCLWDGVSVKTGRLCEHRRLAASLAAVIPVCGVFLFASCAGPQGGAPELPRFSGAANADLIFRYFSDQVSHVEKPLTMEGPFFTACERPTVLKLAAGQPRHALAVIVLIRYFSSTEENHVKLAWTEDLKRLGYQSIVFLLAGRSKEIDGLPILPEPHAPQAVAQQ
jgi:hypothetical protein